jgi:multidrug resistance protein, MATE family
MSSSTPLPKPWREHLVEISRLAVPVMVARAGILVLISVDTAMTGHAGATELAAYAVAGAPLVPLLLLGIGLLSGTTVFVAHALANGDKQEAGRIYRVAQGFAFVAGFVMLMVCLAGEPMLRALGQSPSLAYDGGEVLFWMGLGLPGALAFASCSFVLEALGRAHVGVIVMLLANVLNAGLNWLLIYGNWGFPPMGAEGAALATSIVRWCTWGAVVVYIHASLNRAEYGLTGPNPQARELAARLARFGLPMGLGHALESAAFATMTLFAGWMGTLVVAAYQVAFNLVALPFMIALGFTTAASVHVAVALTRGSPRDALRAGVGSACLAAMSLGVVAIAYVSVPSLFAQLYTDDPALLALCVPAIAFAAWVVVPDGVQGTFMGALRGCRDVWPATGLYMLCFWGLMVPLAYIIGVRGGGGSVELLFATFVGVMAAGVALGLRFTIVLRKISHAQA